MPKPVEVSDEYLHSVGHTRESYEALSRGGKWAVRNKDKAKEATARWVKNNPEKRRATNRRWNLDNIYGIDQDKYDAMLEEQGGACKICGTNTPTGRWKVFAVDHCHDTGDVRGLLCNECNRGIGLLKDDPTLIRKAADYLDCHKKKTAEERKNR